MAKPEPKKVTITSINPATLEILGEVEITPPEAVEGIVQKAREAFPKWRDAGLKERATRIRNVQQLLLERSEDIARLITQEMGRPLTESLVLEVQASLDVTGYYAKRAHTYLDDRRVPLHHLLFMRRKSTMHHEPLGVLGIISPWNWPLLIPMGGIIPALLSGNAVVFKHSELTPLTAVKIQALFTDAGIPESIFQIVQGGSEIGKALVGSSIEKIFFTGSTEVGKEVLRQASHTLKKSVLEMGGSDPAIVCDDADLDITSSGLIWGGFSNCGQNCNGIERVYVHEKIADELITLMTEKIQRLRIGNGMDTETDMGPLASEAQRIKIEAIIEMAVEMGAEVTLGGRRIERTGYFFEPTLIRWDKSLLQPMDIEIFGPIIYYTPVSDDDEAVRLANRSKFGLAASVWTENPKRGNAIARRIEAGTVMINDSIVSFGMPEAGWTGIKNSGIGWVHGGKGLDEMVNIKYINRDPQSHTQKLWWFPYSEGMIRGMKAALAFLFSKNLWKKTASIPRVLQSFTSYLLLNRKRNDKL